MRNSAQFTKGNGKYTTIFALCFSLFDAIFDQVKNMYFDVNCFTKNIYMVSVLLLDLLII